MIKAADYDELTAVLGRLMTRVPFPVAYSLSRVSESMSRIEDEIDFTFEHLERANRHDLTVLKGDLASFVETLMRYGAFVAIRLYETGNKKTAVVDRLIHLISMKPLTVTEHARTFREIMKELGKTGGQDTSFVSDLISLSFNADGSQAPAGKAFDDLIQFRNDIAHAPIAGPEIITVDRLREALIHFQIIVNAISFLANHTLVGIKRTTTSDGASTSHRLQRLTGYAPFDNVSELKVDYSYKLMETHVYLLTENGLENAQRSAWIDLYPLFIYSRPSVFLGEEDSKSAPPVDEKQYFYHEFKGTVRGMAASRSLEGLIYFRCGRNSLDAATTRRREIIDAFGSCFGTYDLRLGASSVDWNTLRGHSEKLVTDFCTQVDFKRHLYVSRPEVETDIDAFVQSDRSVCVITGGPGKGKSYTLAALAKRLRKAGHIVVAINCGQQLPVDPNQTSGFLLSRLGQQSVEMNWEELQSILKGQDKKAIVLLDGLEEYHWGPFSSLDLARKLGADICSKSINAKFVLSCGEAQWLSHHIALKAANPSVIKIDLLSAQQAEEALHRYGQDELSSFPEIVELVRDPFFLHLLPAFPDTSGLHKTKDIADQLMREYYSDRVDPDQREGMVLDCLIELLIEADQRSVRLENLVHKLSASHLPEAGHRRLVDKGVLWEINKQGTKEIGFCHTRFLEHCAVEYFTNRYGSEFAVQDLLGTFFSRARPSQFGYSYAFSVVETHLSEEKDSKLLLDLAKSGRSEGTRLFVNSCKAFIGKDREWIANVITKALKVSDNHSRLAALDAIRTIGGTLYRIILEIVPNEKDPTMLLQAAHVFSLYILEDVDEAFGSLTASLGSKYSLLKSTVKAHHAQVLTFLVNVTLRVLSKQYRDTEAIFRLGRFWKGILPGELLQRLIDELFYPVFKGFVIERLDKRFGEGFHQKIFYPNEVLWFLGELRHDPTGKSLDFVKLKAVYLQLLQSPYELERMTGRLAGMMLIKWRLDDALNMVSRIRDGRVTARDCKEIVVLLGAGAIWSRDYAETLRLPIDDWTEFAAEQFPNFWLNSNPESNSERDYIFAQTGFLRVELGLPVHDIYPTLASRFNDEPQLISAVLRDMAAVGVSAPEPILQTLVEMSKYLDLREPQIRAALVKAFAIISVEHRRLVPNYLEEIIAITGKRRLIEEYQQILYMPETLTEYHQISTDNSIGRAIWGVLVGQPGMWGTLVEFFEELARASTLQEYIEGFALKRLWQVANTL